MEHFKHKNPLIIHNELPNLDGKEICCIACRYPLLSGPFYSCGEPNCYLHKVCAEAPLELKHPLHSDHTLTLVAGRTCFCRCMACSTLSRRERMYECRPCGLRLDLECASMALRIQHECHPHPLIPLLKSALVLCYACGNEHRGVYYKCSSCYFLVHESCASMPSTLKHSHHHHPLTLSRAYVHGYSKFPRFCDICREKLTQYWFYHCIGCRYYAHFSCATSKEEISVDEDEDVLDPNVILLPVPNESINLINQFVKSTKLEEIKIATNLDHFGHPHTLAFFDEQINNELFSRSKGTLCEACVRPISAPVYGCTQCNNYFLHKCCSELPTQIQHPLHIGHPLDLVPKASEGFGIFWCECCNKQCNGFSFHCAKCKDFYLDVKCATLSGPVKHEAHRHRLTPTKLTNVTDCSACSLEFKGLAFKCGICDFIMHSDCAVLPPSLNHRYDKHPFILTYYPLPDHPAEYYCEICEDEVNPKNWFYHCVECDQSIHLYCAQEYQVYSNIKFGASFKVEGHQHPLNFVQFRDEYGSLCNYCGTRLQKYFSFSPGFECGSCEFKLHLQCARDAAKEV
ncbi:Nucleoredoxin 1-1 like [Actinidia chinensis var. chinensis]|uniref:Nucleoredoxin 1-1 like n=1 Tax=Actinidia chinensis var. chinensis TaxID=1590841 RepID=A0A2R6Q4I3_ACTCC|nr:Nucleoredoxin 1-1 like [Actinidia chinensis var. chinensis]